MNYQCNHQICSHEHGWSSLWVLGYHSGCEMLIHSTHGLRLYSTDSSNFSTGSASVNVARNVTGTFFWCLLQWFSSQQVLLKDKKNEQTWVMYKISCGNHVTSKEELKTWSTCLLLLAKRKKIKQNKYCVTFAEFPSPTFSLLLSRPRASNKVTITVFPTNHDI